MPRSTTKTTKVPTPIIDALEALRSPGGPFEGYPSGNALIVGVLRYAVAFPRQHALTAGIANLSPTDQDRIDDYLLAMVLAGKKLPDDPKPMTAEALLKLAKAG